jgi:hypothetical protein
MLLRPTKISLFIVIPVNLYVLDSGWDFYHSTRPGSGSLLDICSGTPGDFMVRTLGLLTILFGVPPAIWGFSQGVMRRAKLSVWTSLIAFALSVTPWPLKNALDSYVIHVHAPQIHKDCDPEHLVS